MPCLPLSTSDPETRMPPQKGHQEGLLITLWVRHDEVLPCVSPTILGYDRKTSRDCPILFHRPWNVSVEPVKWRPAKSGLDIATSAISGPEHGTKLITPGGRPASIIRRINT